MNYLINFLIYLLLLSSIVKANELNKNKGIFEINNQIYTNVDLDRRINYIVLINNINEKELLEKDFDEILNDYISSLIFFEYKEINNFNYENINKEIDIFYKNRIKTNNKNNINDIEINFVKSNIKIDLIRKRIIEDLLNSRKNILNKDTEILDVIYNYKLNYLIFKDKDFKIANINNIKNINDFNNLKNLFIKSEINFFFKNEEILDNRLVSNSIRELINKNKKTKIIKQGIYTKLIFIEKNLASYENILVKLVSFESNIELKKEDLNCNNINNKDKIIYREYEYSKLNDKIKNNLKTLNDYIIIKNEDNKINYIFLCELKYDQKLLNEIDFNKKVQNLAKKLENNFLKKYKKELKFKKL